VLYIPCPIRSPAQHEQTRLMPIYASANASTRAKSERGCGSQRKTRCAIALRRREMTVRRRPYHRPFVYDARPIVDTRRPIDRSLRGAVRSAQRCQAEVQVRCPFSITPHEAS